MTGATELVSGLLGLPERAAWIESTSTLVLADVHLAFSAVERRRGVSGPPVDHDATERLVDVVDKRRPREVVLLGDVAHARPRTQAELEAVVRPLELVLERSELRLVLGNHDRGLMSALPDHLSRLCAANFDVDRFHLTHGDKERGSHAKTTIVGHWHPAVTVPSSSGADSKFPAFLAEAETIALPAFSPVAAGLNVLGARGGLMLEALALQDPAVFACSPSRVVALGSLSKLRDHIRRTGR